MWSCIKFARNLSRATTWRLRFSEFVEMRNIIYNWSCKFRNCRGLVMFKHYTKKIQVWWVYWSLFYLFESMRTILFSLFVFVSFISPYVYKTCFVLSYHFFFVKSICMYLSEHQWKRLKLSALHYVFIR